MDCKGRMVWLAALGIGCARVVVEGSGDTGMTGGGGAAGSAQTAGQGGMGGALAVCGDGVVTAAELCDDGNTAAGDGCSASCSSESGWHCTGSPSLCTDMDECNAGSASCDEHATCTNTPGAFTCICDDGYVGDGSKCGRAAMKLEASIFHTCAVLNGGDVKCWGSNSDGTLGLGDTSDRGDHVGEMGDSLPAIDLGAGKTALSIFPGFVRGCALLNDGDIKCWGRNYDGQLGQGNLLTVGDDPGEMGDKLPPIDLGSGKSAVAMAAGNEHTCALLSDGGVKCWGINEQGQLGLGDVLYRGGGPNQMGDDLPAVDLGTGRTAITISTKFDHTCALLDDGSVKCWGENNHGELGIEKNIPSWGNMPDQMGDNLPAVDLGTGKKAVAISCGYRFTCALASDGTIKCWGLNSEGQLGLGDKKARGEKPGQMGDNLPGVDLGSGKTAVAISAGNAHACALLNDGSLKCWGSNWNGRLGLGLPGLSDASNRGDKPGEMGDSLPAVDLGTGKKAAAVSAGSQTCALLMDGTVKCWGLNEFGELGLGNTVDRGDEPGEMGDNLPAVDL
jgi:cysteine-rich repeat protein